MVPDFSVEAVQKGCNVEIRLTAANRTEEEMHLEFPTSKLYDFTIYDETGKPVYTFGKGKFYLQAFQHLTLKKGERKTWVENWKGGAGTYTVKAVLLSSKINGKSGGHVQTELQFTIHKK